MAMSREEALLLVVPFEKAIIKERLSRGTLEWSAAFLNSADLRDQLLTALCADPNAALLEACKRLYDICEGLTARQVLDLDDDAVERGTRGLVEGTNKIDLEWARIVIAAAEGENER